jgi:hypothetical protein
LNNLVLHRQFLLGGMMKLFFSFLPDCCCWYFLLVRLY